MNFNVVCLRKLASNYWIKLFFDQLNNLLMESNNSVSFKYIDCPVIAIENGNFTNIGYFESVMGGGGSYDIFILMMLFKCFIRFPMNALTPISNPLSKYWLLKSSQRDYLHGRLSIFLIRTVSIVFVLQ